MPPDFNPGFRPDNGCTL